MKFVSLCDNGGHYNHVIPSGLLNDHRDAPIKARRAEMIIEIDRKNQ